jgi:hypothetical protein
VAALFPVLHAAHGLLGLELEVGVPAERVERAGIQRRQDGAAGLLVVAAVVELAGAEEGLDVGEGPADALGHVGELDLAQSRGVEQDGACGGEEHLPRRGGVAAAAVLADLLCGLHLPAEDAVHQSGLAGARGAQERHRGGRLEVLRQDVHAVALLGADDVDGEVAGDEAGLGEAGSGVGAEVRLIKEDDAPRPALADHGQVALEAAEVEVVVQTADDEDDVHVGDEDLDAVALAGLLAGHDGPAGEDALDDALGGLEVHGHPVPDGGELAALREGELELPGDGRVAVAALGPQPVQAPLTRRHPRRRQPRRGMDLERVRPSVVPADLP